MTMVAGQLLTAVSAAAALEAIVLRFQLSTVMQRALAGSLTVAMQSPPPVTGVIGQASAQTSRQNLARRAQFVVSAGRRLASDMAGARAQGVSIPQALAGGLTRERRYYGLHLAAMWQRSTAAGQIDMEAAVHGPLLGWYAKRDNRVTAACLKADGCNFTVSPPPAIGLPGIGPHVGCRCSAGPPHPGGRLLAGSGRQYARAA